MPLPEQCTLLRIFIGESDRSGHKPLYEALVLKARETGLAGATVLRSPMGFGATSKVHSTKILQLSNDLPIVIEIADEESKIEAFLPRLSAMFEESNSGGLVTVEKVEVVRYLHKK